ncbi:hypothetical protein [Nocardia sp. NPDC057440]|uniref:hypothetical protein n=1 Tax=Nocardia sp. NPDC057440 TaxID=3346134 RepID=UPI00366CC1D7
MTKFLLSVHVLAAIIAVGPVTVAASMFPAFARRAVAEPVAGQPIVVLRTLHRICRVYAAVGIVVPVFGFATAISLGVLGDRWLMVSIVLTAAAAGVLALMVLPDQAKILTGLTGMPHPNAPARAVISQLAMYTGTFNLLWATVTVLMIIRPGSTTAA